MLHEYYPLLYNHGYVMLIIDTYERVCEKCTSALHVNLSDASLFFYTSLTITPLRFSHAEIFFQAKQTHVI